MTSIPFVTLDEPDYGVAEQVSPLVRRVIAHNPSKYTYRGTGTYIVGRGQVTVIDPGPVDDAHRDALRAALVGETVTAILVTHCHADHSPLAAWLREETGAPTVAQGPHGEVRDHSDALDQDEPDEELDALAREAAAAATDGNETVKLDESVDTAFVPDVFVGDGEVAAGGDGWSLRAVHTPGHTSNHLCFALDAERALFTGDHIMGWSTTVIGPPDGDMRAYFESLHKVQGRTDERFWPTHGAPITDTRPFLDAFVAHRLDREAQVIRVVRGGEASIAAMVKVLYADVRKELYRPAARSVLAHLVKLVDDGVVTTADGERPRLRSRYHPA